MDNVYMSFWQAESIRGQIGGSWVVPPCDAKIAGASIDSRTARTGNIFFALPGERVDGHQFVQGATDAGCAIAIISDEAKLPDGAKDRARGMMSLVRVPDVAAALRSLGTACRRSLGATRVISVGGSNGKTTTTRLIESVLAGGATALRGTASPKSFNNAIGVPLTILNARPGDDFLVCEVGTNAPGEIATLAHMVKPDIAVITSIGREHLEGLGSIEGVVREESAILAEIATGGLAVIHADAPMLVNAARAIRSAPGESCDWSTLRFGTDEQADLRLSDIQTRSDGIQFVLNGRETFAVPLLGAHNAMNAAAAIAVGLRFGLSYDQIRAGLSRVKPPPWRMERSVRRGVIVINDAYNANPESMRAAIHAFADLTQGARRRIVVLGDMLELGEQSPALHAEIGREVARVAGVDRAVFIGPLSASAAQEARHAGVPKVEEHAASSEDTLRAIAMSLVEGDAVLLKGSRGMGLERLVGFIAE